MDIARNTAQLAIRYAIVALFGAFLMIAGAPLIKVISVEKAMARAASLRRAGLQLTAIKVCDAALPQASLFPPLLRRLQCEAIRSHLGLRDLASAERVASGILESSHPTPAPSGNPWEEIENRMNAIVSGILTSVGRGHDLSEWCGYEILTEEAIRSSDRDVLKTLAATIGARDPGNPLTRKIANHLESSRPSATPAAIPVTVASATPEYLEPHNPVQPPAKPLPEATPEEEAPPSESATPSPAERPSVPATDYRSHVAMLMKKADSATGSERAFYYNELRLMRSATAQESFSSQDVVDFQKRHEEWRKAYTENGGDTAKPTAPLRKSTSKSSSCVKKKGS